jgi:hypothetical protein
MKNSKKNLSHNLVLKVKYKISFFRKPSEMNNTSDEISVIPTGLLLHFLLNPRG